ncbi:MAG: ATP-binding cassette domain-containing protein, partial [Cyanobacteria bacterium J06649_5]
MTDPILDVQGLTVEFAMGKGPDSRRVRAVDRVSFQLQRGQTMGIVGESGSGKSVTSLAIMGLVPTPPGQVSAGRILFTAESGQAPVDLLEVPRRKLRRYRGGQIAMIFQDPMSSLNPVYTCGFQLIEAIRQ